MKIKKYKNLIMFTISLILIIFILAIYQIIILRKAHSTFDNYYSFRNCVKLIDRTNDYGTCETTSGKTIKIVKFDNRWFLDGDLPCGFLCF